MTEPLAPGAVIGILGGGQLGRMLAVAAARLGFRSHVFEPEPDCPASHMCDRVTKAPYSDIEALSEFARSVDVVTFEFENIPATARDTIERHVHVRPPRKALTVSQDRLKEKEFLTRLGLSTAPFCAVTTDDDLARAIGFTGLPAILKTRRLGYDGKGQVRITGRAEAAGALASMNGADAILEGLVPFEAEISVIGARGRDGRVVCFDPGENVHKDGILRTTTVPASLSLAQSTDAVIIAGRILNALDYVGVLGVELFVTGTGFVVNEFAPRVHNSGHWTQNACLVDQFEQHIRAIAGWPLGDGQRHSDVTMTNLIGDEVTNAAVLAADPAVALHLYGKTDIRDGRKMGHVNRLMGRPD